MRMQSKLDVILIRCSARDQKYLLFSLRRHRVGAGSGEMAWAGEECLIHRLEDMSLQEPKQGQTGACIIPAFLQNGRQREKLEGQQLGDTAAISKKPHCALASLSASL